MLSSVYTWEGCKISTSLGMGSIDDREQEQERHGSHDLGSRRMAIFSFVCLIFFLCLAVLLLFCVFVSLFGTQPHAGARPASLLLVIFLLQHPKGCNYT